MPRLNRIDHIFKVLSLAVVVVGLATSSASAWPGEVQMRFQLRPDGSKWAFYDRGFPSDFQSDEQGRIDFSAFPHPWLNVLVDEYKKVIRRDARGFAPESPIYARLLGASKGMLSFSGMTPMDFTQRGAPVQLIDVDPMSPDRGTRYPIAVQMAPAEEAYRPADLLQIRPMGRVLREGTKYALIVMKAVVAGGAAVPQSNPILLSVLNGRNPRELDPRIPQDVAERALTVYQPLRQELVRQGLSANQILAAVAWTTGSPADTAAHIAAAAHAWPLPPLKSPWKMIAQTEDFCVLKAMWTVPGLQRGAIPFALPLAGGRITYGDDGAPEVAYYRDTPVVITVPKAPMPDDGFPLVLYHHGTGGDADQIWNRGLTLRDAQGNETLTKSGSVAEVAAIRGWAGAGMGGHFGAEHQASLPVMNWVFGGIALPMNIVQYNFLNPQAMRDSLLQQLAERVLFRRMVKQAQLSPALCPQAAVAAGDAIRFDQNMEVVMGQSLGSFTASAQASMDPDPVRGLIVTGAGTYNIDLVMQITALGNGDKPLGASLGPAFFGAHDFAQDPFHPLYALAEHALAPANTAYMVARKKENEPMTRRHPVHVLAVEGYVDDWVTLPNQRQLIRALGASMAGPEVDVKDQAKDLLLPSALNAGGHAFAYPAAGNDATGASNFFVRYAQDPIKSGHYVFFQLAAPKHQVGCFLQDMKAGLTPTLVQGLRVDGPCASGVAPGR